MSINQYALVVQSCDRYSLLFKGFLYFFKKHWDFNLPIKLYFITEDLTLNDDKFVNIKSGYGPWSNRLKKALDLIPESNIIYLQEDFWLNADVDSDFFLKLFESFDLNKWKLVKLHSSSIYVTKETGAYINNFAVTKVDNSRSQFLISHQISLWDKKFLQDQLKDNEHPWRNERMGSKRLKKINPEIIHIDYFKENGSNPINKNLNHPKFSGYYSVSRNACFLDISKPYLDEMLSDPEHQSYATQCYFHLQNQITHDGKPKPMKRDSFKLFKIYLKGKFNKYFKAYT